MQKTRNLGRSSSQGSFLRQESGIKSKLKTQNEPIWRKNRDKGRRRSPEKPGTPLVKPPGTAQNTGREPRSNPTTRGLDPGPLRGAEEMTDGCKEGPRTPTPFQRKANDWAVHLHEPAKELTAPRIRRFTTYSRWGGTPSKYTHAERVPKPHADAMIFDESELRKGRLDRRWPFTLPFSYGFPPYCSWLPHPLPLYSRPVV